MTTINVNGAWAYQEVATVVGQQYIIRANLVNLIASLAYLRVVNNPASPWSHIASDVMSSPRYAQIIFTATAAKTYIMLGVTSTSLTDAAEWDNASFRLTRYSAATQNTTLSKPTLARWPKGGQRNLLTRTGFDGAVSGTPGTAPTDWPAVSTGGTITFTAGAASLGGGTLRVAVASNRHFFNQTIILAATGTWTASMDLFVTDNGINMIRVGQLLRQGAAPADATYEYTLNGSVVAETAIVPIGVNRLLWRVTTTGTGGQMSIRFGLGTSMNVTGDVTFSNIQFELGSTATPYQRVTTQYDITEAGVPDVWHLYNDGGDSLPISVPAGTYGRAAISHLGEVAFSVVTLATSGPIETLVYQRQADVIIRQGDFTQQEKDKITQYATGLTS